MRDILTGLTTTAALRQCPNCGRWNRLDLGRDGATCGACGSPIDRSGERRGEPVARARPALRTAVRVATLLYVVALFGAWWSMTAIGERWWVTAILLYLPRILLGLPLIPLAILGLFADRRTLLIHGGCILALAGPIMGWHQGSGEAAPAGVKPIRVLTYNIGSKPRATPALLRVVEETRPDVVAVQETPDLKALFPGWKTYYAGEFFMATRLPLLEVEDRQLLPEWSWRRGVRCRIRGPQGAFNLFILHFDTPRRAFEELKAPARAGFVQWRNLPNAQAIITDDARRRAREATNARAWIGSTHGLHLIAGDFNQPPDSQLYRPLWGGYRDAWEIAGRGYGYTAHAPRPWIRIDHILGSPEWRFQRAWTPAGSGRDHLPLVADAYMVRGQPGKDSPR